QRAPGPPTSAIPPVTITVVSIDQAVLMALQRNPTIEEATAAIRHAVGVVEEARANLRPRVDATARFTIIAPIPTFTHTVPPTPAGGRASTVERPLGSPFSRVFHLGASYQAAPFTRLHDLRRSAQNSERATRGGYFVEQNELAYTVQTVYLQALRSNELIGVA